MRRIVLLCALLTGLMFGSAYAQKGGDEKDIRSDLPGEGTNPFNYSKYPQPFNQYNQSKNIPSVSTGYYFNDNVRDGDLETPNYSPSFTSFQQPDRFETGRWIQVTPGPRILDSTFWDNRPSGLHFFRNPALPVENGGKYFSFSNSFGTDSTDDAIAGPMPLGLRKAFLFNGIAYDSFYVSTNGLMALTNKRYTYNDNGERAILPGKSDAYNVQSMDWFVAAGVGRPRASSGIGSLNDNAPDDFGYRYSVLGNETGATLGDADGGIRSYPTNGRTIDNVIPQLYRTAIIAPFWADLQASQWDGNNDRLDPKGEVWFKTNETQDYLTVYFKKFQFRSKNGNSVWTPTGSAQIGEDVRFGGGQLVPAASAQVYLDTRDTSITIVYGEFEGNLTLGGRTWNSNDIFRWNSIAGVRGFARHVNYGRPGGPDNPGDPQPWVGEYPQYTEYWRFERNPFQGPNYPTNLRAVRFKQLQNTLRVEAIEYRVRSLDPNANLDYTQTVPAENVNNYELYADPSTLRLGSIQPVAIIQNLSNNIQGPATGVNYVRQDLDFQARFRVVNKATAKVRYNRLVPINERCLEHDDNNGYCDGRSFEDIDYVSVRVENGKLVVEDKQYVLDNPATESYSGEQYDGLPPYEFVRVFFPPWTPSPYLDADIGRMQASITAEPVRNNGQKLNDAWPFDDVRSVNLFVLRNLANFYDDGNEFHVVDDAPMPSVLKWVNIGAAMAQGTVVSDYPLPPRTLAEAANNELFPNYFLDSPTIEMNRVNLTGTDWTQIMGQPWGDIIASFPIDIRDKAGAVLSVSIQRTRKRDSWDRGYSDLALIGPEPRAVLNSALLNHFRPGTTASANPDSIVVEFARPSSNGIENIVNIPNDQWRYLPRRGKTSEDNDAVERGIPALTVFGGGGYISPFYEEDRDSILPPPTAADPGGLKANFYDTGIDFGFNKYFIPIPDTFVNAPNNGGLNFRFRIRVVASNDQKCIVCIPDDSDNFYVDNVTLLEGNEEATDLEISKVFARWPYTVVPATQATEVPIKVQVSNNTSTDAPFYFSQVIIWRGGINQVPRDNQQVKNINDGIEPVYCRKLTIPQQLGGSDKTWDLPAFNAKDAGEGLYTLMGIVHIPGGDRDIRNDTTYTEFEVKFGDDFGYDPENATNDVPGVTGAKPGQGLGTFGYALGGIGNANGYIGQGFAPIPVSVGDVGGSGSGTIAMKFELVSADTIYGYKAFFGEVNQAPDDIQFRLYEDNDGNPGEEIDAGRLVTVRGYDYIRTPQTGDYYFDEYVSYKLQDSVILQKGNYWIGIVQLGQTSLELGANGTRGAQRTLNVSIELPIGPMGIAGVQSNVHPEFRIENSRGNLINRNFFALENTAGSGNWNSFTPPVGNNAYPHLDHAGRTTADNTTQTLTRGFWIPLLRPMFGNKASGLEGVEKPCPEWIPVELTEFKARPTAQGVDLFWETASEIDNYGFYIERRDVTPGVESDWAQIDFVKGNGTTTSTSRYSFTDRGVVNGHTYAYKLRQVDRDGSQACYETLVETVMYGGNSFTNLDVASPNPFGMSSNITEIDYTVAEGGNVTLEIVDIFGNTVKTLVNGEMAAGSYTATWDATNDAGSQVATGNYIYRLTTNGETLTNKVQYRK